MNKAKNIVTAAMLMAWPAFVQAVDISGKVGVQSRLFSDDGSFQNSVMLEPEWYWADAGQQNSFLLKAFGRYDDLDAERSHIDIQEALWLHVADGWEFRAGIAKVFWGVTESNQLVDVINQTDLVEAVDGKQKLGQAMLHATMIRDWGIVDAFVLPGFRQRTFAGKNGRLHGGVIIDSDNALFEHPHKQDHIDLALRYSHTVDVLDFGIGWFKGTNREPIIIPLATVADSDMVSARPYYDQMQQLSLDMQATLADWLLKVEVIHRQDSLTQFAAFAAGFEYTLVGWAGTDVDVGLLAEYSRDSRNSRSTSLFQNDLFLGIRWGFNDVQSTELLLGYVQDLSNSSSATAFIEGSRRLGSNWKLVVDIRTFASSNSNELLHGIRHDDYAAVTLEYFF